MYRGWPQVTNHIKDLLLVKLVGEIEIHEGHFRGVSVLHTVDCEDMKTTLLHSRREAS